MSDWYNSHTLDKYQKMCWDKFIKRMKSELMIWSTNSLKTIKVSEGLKSSLNNLPFGKILESNIVNGSQHLLLTIERRTILQGFQYYNFLLFEIASGELVLILVFDISNEDPFNNPNDLKTSKPKSKMRLMNIMVNENKQKTAQEGDPEIKLEREETEYENFVAKDTPAPTGLLNIDNIKEEDSEEQQYSGSDSFRTDPSSLSDSDIQSESEGQQLSER